MAIIPRRDGNTTAPANPAGLLHASRGAYARGELLRAVDLAEQAATAARGPAGALLEGSVLSNLGVLHMWSGDFPRAAAALDAAEAAYLRMPNMFARRGWPLARGVRASLHALRGVQSAAEESFARAVSAARSQRSLLYEAIVRTLRAQYTAGWERQRSCQDARWAREVLAGKGEQRWALWARHAYGVVMFESGMTSVAEAALREVLDLRTNHLERAHGWLSLGELLLRADRPERAREALHIALATFDAERMRYWAARACVALSAAAPDRAAYWIGRARAVALPDPAYERLFDTPSSLSLEVFGSGAVRCGQHRPRFRTHNAERALFCLALSGADGLHREALADRLWPEASTRQVAGRLRTLMWDIRQGLAAHRWRLRREGPVLLLDLSANAGCDVLEARGAAAQVLSGGGSGAVAGNGTGATVATLAAQLRRPILTRWAYDGWVLAEHDRNLRLADQLESCS